jgi:hypothetical protein
MLAFVPVVPSTPSPRAEALGQRLAEAIEQYRQQNPGLSRIEVRQATRIAISRASGTSAVAPALVVLVAAVAGMGVALALASGRHPAGSEWTTTMLVAAIAVVLGVLVALKRR